MGRRKLPVITVLSIMLLSNTITAGKTFIFHSCFAAGHIIAHPLHRGICIGPVVKEHFCVPPFHGKVIITSPLRSCIVPVCPPGPGVVLVKEPHVAHIEVAAPPAAISHTIVTAQTTVTVWITNSNGSRTAVNLVKSGPWFVGPRGEWYTDMPTEAQLRAVYGF